MSFQVTLKQPKKPNEHLGGYRDYMDARLAIRSHIDKYFQIDGRVINSPSPNVTNVYCPKEGRYSTQANMLATYVIKEIE